MGIFGAVCQSGPSVGGGAYLPKALHPAATQGGLGLPCPTPAKVGSGSVYAGLKGKGEGRGTAVITSSGTDRDAGDAPRRH